MQTRLTLLAMLTIITSKEKSDLSQVLQSTNNLN